MTQLTGHLAPCSFNGPHDPHKFGVYFLTCYSLTGDKYHQEFPNICPGRDRTSTITTDYNGVTTLNWEQKP